MSAQRFHAERGQVVVEFSLVVSAALVLLFGIFDTGRALFAYDAVSNAARVGSRFAMVRGSTCEVAACPATSASIQTYVQEHTPGLEPSQLTVTARWPGGNVGCTSTPSPYQGPGCLVIVNARYNFTYSLLWFLQKGSFPISSTSEVVISQ